MTDAPPVASAPTKPYYNIVSSQGMGHFMLQSEWDVYDDNVRGGFRIVCTQKHGKATVVFYNPVLFEKVIPDASKTA